MYTKLLTTNKQGTYTLVAPISNFKWLGIYGRDNIDDSGNMYGFTIIPTSVFIALCATDPTALRYGDVILAYARYVDDTHIATSNVSINNASAGYIHIIGIK